MENSYGIGITNRYDLFCMDDDANDMESILSKKAKQQKKAAAAAAKLATISANESQLKKLKIFAATLIKDHVKGDDRRGGHGQNAPKVDDEHDFPSLN